jgi:hypothetical protein
VSSFEPVVRRGHSKFLNFPSINIGNIDKQAAMHALLEIKKIVLDDPQLQ